MQIAESNANLPQNIDRIIDAKGMKQGAIAKRAGFTVQQMSDMLNGRRIIKPVDVIAFAKALNVDIQVLYDGNYEEDE